MRPSLPSIKGIDTVFSGLQWYRGFTEVRGAMDAKPAAVCLGS